MFILSKHSYLGIENVSSFLSSSLLSALEECFSFCKTKSYTHNMQHKVFYCSIVPATKDGLRTHCWLGSAEASCYWSPSTSNVWRMKVASASACPSVIPYTLRPSHHPTGSNSEKLMQSEVSHCRAIAGMLFLEWEQEEPKKRRASLPSSHDFANMIPSCWSFSSNGFDPELCQLLLIAM